MARIIFLPDAYWNIWGALLKYNITDCFWNIYILREFTYKLRKIMNPQFCIYETEVSILCPFPNHLEHIFKDVIVKSIFFSFFKFPTLKNILTINWSLFFYVWQPYRSGLGVHCCWYLAPSEWVSRVEPSHRRLLRPQHQSAATNSETHQSLHPVSAGGLSSGTLSRRHLR